MPFATKPKSFFEIANDSSKRFCLESFSFTHQCGLNIWFDDLDDLKQITQDVEFEFWSLLDDQTDAELDVDNFTSLNMLLNFLENVDADSERLISTYEKLVSGNYASWNDVESWHSEHYVCDFVNNEDFGYYLIEELGCIEIPEEIQHYFDYEAYGRDALISDYLVAAGKVYTNY